MLVDHRRVARPMDEPIAALHHRAGQRGDLRRRHALEVNGHGEGRHLIVRHLAAGVALDELGDLAGRKLLALPLAGNQRGDVH